MLKNMKIYDGILYKIGNYEQSSKLRKKDADAVREKQAAGQKVTTLLSGGNILRFRKRDIIMEFINILTNGKEYKEQVYALYEEAFPAEEKKPLGLMEELAAQGKMELLAIVEDGEFIGLAMNMLSDKAALLDYFAIAADRRSGGFGGRAVRMLQERFDGRKYIFEIEKQDPEADNASDRKRRKEFYLRNGLKETGIFANVYHTDFELLTPDGSLTFQEYVEMLAYILGDEGLHILEPTLL